MYTIDPNWNDDERKQATYFFISAIWCVLFLLIGGIGFPNHPDIQHLLFAIGALPCGIFFIMFIGH